MSLSFSQVNDVLVPFENDQALSGNDPWKEAREWVSQLVVTDKECLVVGLGGGFHIVELIRQKNLTKVYVIESRSGLLNLFRKQFPELQDKVDVIIVDTPNALLKHEVMDEVMTKHLSSFAFTASWPKNDKSYREFHRHLTGRSAEALKVFFQRFGLSKEIQITDEAGSRYLSIKDLELLIQEDVPPYLRVNCFRILKELIV